MFLSASSIMTHLALDYIILRPLSYTINTVSGLSAEYVDDSPCTCRCWCAFQYSTVSTPRPFPPRNPRDVMQYCSLCVNTAVQGMWGHIYVYYVVTKLLTSPVRTSHQIVYVQQSTCRTSSVASLSPRKGSLPFSCRRLHSHTTHY